MSLQVEVEGHTLEPNVGVGSSRSGIADAASKLILELPLRTVSSDESMDSSENATATVSSHFETPGDTEIAQTQDSHVKQESTTYQPTTEEAPTTEADTMVGERSRVQEVEKRVPHDLSGEEEVSQPASEVDAQPGMVEKASLQVHKDQWNRRLEFEFRKLIVLRIAQHLRKDDVEKISFIFNVPTRMRESNSAVDVLYYLMQEEMFSCLNMEPLIKLLKDISRHDLSEEVESFKDGKESSCSSKYKSIA